MSRRTPIGGAFGPPREGEHVLGPMQKVDVPMRRYPTREPVDACVVGVGSAGGVLVQRLARAGFSVVGLEAGMPEPWEVEERRYPWRAPPVTITHRYELVAGTEEHTAIPGQGGTH